MGITGNSLRICKCRKKPHPFVYPSRYIPSYMFVFKIIYVFQMFYTYVFKINNYSSSKKTGQHYLSHIVPSRVFSGCAMIKNPSASAGDTRDGGFIPKQGNIPCRRTCNPLQYSCLGNPMNRGDWWATVHGVTKSRTRLNTEQHSQGSSSKFTW